MESFGVPSVSPPPPCSPGSDSSSIGATHHSSPPAAVVEGSYMSRKARAFSIDALLADQSSPASSICEDSDVEADENTRQTVISRDCSVEPEQLSPLISNEEMVEEKLDISESLSKSHCLLEMTDLWKKFHELGTEMIITKSGRRMFPSLRVSFTDLDPKANYQVFFDVAAVDNKRYRYAYHRSSWLVAGRADPPIPRRVYTHPDGPFRGDSLMKQSISFEKVKLTNNLHDKWGYIVLNSMHKYQPRVHLVKYDDKVPSASVLSDLPTKDRKVFTFPETQFIGVTAYQNQLITKLKIDSNPFAKGFRDSARITQIDRESVDLLIKASRHGYPSLHTSMGQHPMFNNPSSVQQAHMSLLQQQSNLMSKYPSLLPNIPMPAALLSQQSVSKDLLKVYFDQLSAASIRQDVFDSQQQSSPRLPPSQLRFNPYKR